MKTLLTFFVLFFSSLVFAEDISDFEIERMSVGDSLLDYLSEEEIINLNKRIYPNGKFAQVDIQGIKLKFYDAITATIKLADKNYLIYEVKGFKRQESNPACLKQKKILTGEFSDSLNTKANIYEKQTSEDTSGNSTTNSSDFHFESGTIRIYCINWSKEMRRRGGYYDDSITIIMFNNEFRVFLIDEAYK